MSDAARKIFAGMLRELQVPSGWCMRLKVRGSDLLLGLDSPRDDDHIYEYEGRVVLTADRVAAAACFGMVLEHRRQGGFALVQAVSSHELPEQNSRPVT